MTNDEAKAEKLIRTFHVELKGGDEYRVKDVKVSPGDMLSPKVVVLELEASRTKKSGDAVVTETRIESIKFAVSHYEEPIVTTIFVSEGQELAPGKHPIFEYRVEENLTNLLELSARELCVMKRQFYFGSKIPESKRSNAVAEYADSVDPDRVIFLYDDTWFGSAKEGFLITDSGFYYRKGNRRLSFRFNDVESATIETRQSDSDQDVTRSVLVISMRDGSTHEIPNGWPGIKIKPLESFINVVITLEHYIKDVDGFVIVEDMPSEVKVDYLKILVWSTYQRRQEIDKQELSELQVLMAQLNFDAECRQAVRVAIHNPADLDVEPLCERLMANVPSGSEVALGISLLKDAVRMHRATSESSALKDETIDKLAQLLDINKDQIRVIEEACILDEQILAGELSDNQLTAAAKDMASKAGAVGLPIAAVYLSGSVVGLSAAGVTSGLATLGLGGVLGLSSMVTGIGVAILLGVGVYKGAQWLFGTKHREKASRREIMLQEVLRIHQKSIGNLAEDVAYFAKQILELTQNVKENQLTIDKLSRELTVFIDAIDYLRQREGNYEQELAAEVAMQED